MIKTLKNWLMKDFLSNIPIVVTYLVVFFGVVLISFGVSLYSFPAGFIVSGVLLVLIAIDSRML